MNIEYRISKWLPKKQHHQKTCPKNTFGLIPITSSCTHHLNGIIVQNRLKERPMKFKKGTESNGDLIWYVIMRPFLPTQPSLSPTFISLLTIIIISHSQITARTKGLTTIHTTSRADSIFFIGSSNCLLIICVR